jgi:protocatechuate 3,4-dioxygenase beta subunit
MKKIVSYQLALVPTLVAASVLSRYTGFFGPGGRISRRGLITSGGLGLTILAASAWRGRAASAAVLRNLTAGAPETLSASTSSAVACVLTPEETEGPYYIAKEKVRSIIAEHKPGTPLTLRLTVVSAATCTPIKGAVVDIWHCDATGIYSGFQQASTGASPGGGPGSPGGNAGPTDHATFLRGIQLTNAQGVAEFKTIYPGWYRGRTTHIHVKVHVGGSVAHTGQLFFPDSLTSKVYQTGPYKARAAARDTFNNTDSVYSVGGPQSMLTLKRLGIAGYSGTMSLGVQHI